MANRLIFKRVAGVASLAAGVALYAFGFSNSENLFIKAVALSVGSVAGAAGIFLILRTAGDTATSVGEKVQARAGTTPLGGAAAILFFAMGTITIVLAGTVAIGWLRNFGRYSLWSHVQTFLMIASALLASRYSLRRSWNIGRHREGYTSGNDEVIKNDP